MLGVPIRPLRPEDLLTEEDVATDDAVLNAGQNPMTQPGALPSFLAPRAPVPPAPSLGTLTAGPIPGSMQELLDQIEQEQAPIRERGIVGEAVSSFARGAVPGALETTGQALRGVGAEGTGTTLRELGGRIEQGAPGLFARSQAAQEGGFRGIVANAFESVGRSLAISAPAIAATVASGGGATPVMLAYILSTPGVFGAAEYQTFLDESRKAGIPDDVARSPAIASALAEAGFEAAGNAMEALLVTRGIARPTVNAMKASLRQGIKGVMLPKVTDVAKTIALSGVAEGGTEALTEVAQSAIREGIGIEPGPSQTFEAAASGALAGLIFGGLGSGIMGQVRRADLRTLASPTADQTDRRDAVDRVIETLQNAPEGAVDPDLITSFTDYAYQAVANEQAIPLSEDLTQLVSGVRPAAPSPQASRPMLPSGVQAALPETPESRAAEAEAQRLAGERITSRLERGAGTILQPGAQPIEQGASLPADLLEAARPSTLALPPGPPPIPIGPSGAASILAASRPPGLLQPALPPGPEAQVTEEPVLPPEQPVVPSEIPMLPQPTQEPVALPVQPTAPAQPSEEPAATAESPLPAGEGEAVAPTSPTQGRSSEYFTPSGRSYPFAYELIEASEAIPSHDPSTFQQNPLYADVSGMPLGALQDRPYHRDSAEQAKILEQDRRFGQRFWFMLSDSPDATNGPPIVPQDSNVVVGGNSRMMTILRKIREQDPSAYQAYRAAVKERASLFGIDPAQVEQMQAPVLVRRLNNVSTNDPQALQRAARESNESFTQSLSETSQAVASGKAMSAETISFLAGQVEAMGESTTLRDYFRAAGSRELVRRLTSDGVLTQRTLNKYVDQQTGLLDEDGKTLVERAMLGRIIPDSDLIEASAPSTVNTLLKSLPAIAQLQSRGELWDISRQLPEAVRLVNDTRINGWRSVDEHLQQQSLFGESRANPVTIAMARTLMNPKPTQIKRAFDRFAQAANRDVAGQGTFSFTPAQPPWEAFNDIFEAELADATYRESMSNAAPQAPRLGESFQFQARTRAQGGGQAWQLTEGEVQAAFPGRSVVQMPGGGFRVETPAGYVDLVEVDQIQMGDDQRAAFEVGYGTPYNEDVTVEGRIVNEQGKSRIELVKGEADRITLLHEVEHFLENSGLLTPEEIHQLGEASRKGDAEATAEDRAQWVAEQLNERRYRRDSTLGRILDKVWDFFDSLLNLVGFDTTRGVLRRIESGQVINRDNGAVINTDQTMTGQQFQANRATSRDIPKENKLYSEYLGWANMAGPEVTELFDKANVSYLKQRIDRKTMSELASKVAESWLDNPSAFKRVLDNYRLHQRIPSTEEMEALRMVGASMADAILQARRDGTLNDEQFYEMLPKLVGPNSIFATTVGISSEAGRLLRFLQEKPPAEKFFELMVAKRQKLGEFLNDQQIKDYEQAFNKVLLDGDPVKLQQFFGKLEAENPSIWDYFKEYWYGSVLSGTGTQLANFGGNTLWTYFNLGIMRGLEGILDPFIAKWQNRPAQRFLSEVFPALGGFSRGLARGERWRTIPGGLKTGEFHMPGVTGFGKFERDLGIFSSAWQNATWQLDFPTMRRLGLDVGKTRRVLKQTFGIEPGQPINFARTVAPWVSLATRAMVGMDLLGKAAARDGIIASLAERQAQQELQAGTITQADMARRRAELITHANDPTNALGREMNQQAMTEAARLTFTDEPSQVAKWILQGRRIPFLGRPFQMLVPFVSTPDRLISNAIGLLPGIGLLPYRDVVLNLRGSGVDATALIARQVAGTALFTMVWALFEAGLATGDVPDDPNEREAFFRSGKQPWALKIGDNYVSYRRFEPLNLVMGTAPVIINAIRKAQERDNEIDTLSLLSYAGATMAHHVLEGSYLSGLQGFFQAVGKGGAGQTESGVTRLVDSWIPYAGMRRTIVRAIDAYETEQGSILREPQGFFEHISGANLALNVRPRYDTWGRPITVPGTVFAQFIPWRVSTANRDVTEQELARFEIFPGPPSQQDAKGKKIAQPDYDFLVARGGQMAKANLDKLVRQPHYQSLSPELREVYLRRVIRQSREAAREELERRSRAKQFLLPREQYGTPVSAIRG